MTKTQKYDESNIQALIGLEGIRKKPGMYVGELGDKALFTLIREAFDNTTDEFLAGRNKFAQIVVQDGKYLVHDMSGGIPVGVNKQLGMSTLTAVFTHTHTSGKFDSNAYKTSAGTHGVGNKAITALSNVLDVWTHRDGQWYHQQFKKGKVATEVKKAKPPADVVAMMPKKPTQGTILLWQPDLAIIGLKAKLKDHEVIAHAEAVTMLNRGFEVWVKINGHEHKYLNKKGPAAFVEAQAAKLGVEVTGKPLVIESPHMDLAIQLSSFDLDSGVCAYTNSCRNVDGGKHVDAFWAAMMVVLRKHANTRHKFTLRDIRYGLIGYINLKVSGPAFSSQTKEKLVGFSHDDNFSGAEANAKPEKVIEKFLTPLLTKAFDQNKAFAKAILARATEVGKAREATKELMESISEIRENAKKGGDLLPDILYTATKASPEERELFLVEGDSAGGTAKYARFKEYQEVLQLSGKPLNAARATDARILGNEPIQNILISIGYDPEKEAKTGRLNTRIGNIFLLADPDPDGYHINVLVLTGLYKMMPKMFEEGRVYVVNAPLYTADVKGKLYFANTLEEIKAKLPEGASTKSVTRLKGWGEASAEQLRVIAFDPKTREVYKVKPVTGEDNRMFFALVGDDVDARKELLGLE